MTPVTVPSEAATYLQSLRKELADLPAEEREELLSDVETSLIEAGDSDGSPAARLGSPATFAHELRTAAGLQAESPSKTPAPSGRSAFDRLMDSLRGVSTAPAFKAVQRLYRELAPLWWVIRGYALIVAIAMLTRSGDQRFSLTHSAMPKIGHESTGVVLVVVAVLASVGLGLWARARGPFNGAGPVFVLANLALMVAAVPALWRLTEDHQLRNTVYFDSAAGFAASFSSEPGTLVGPSGAKVDNIYAYSRDGKPLYDVLLYDGSGNPLNIGNPDGPADPTRRVLVTANGARLFNSFPIRYFENGSTRIANPTAAPRIQLRPGRIATPPLKIKPAARGAKP